MEWLLYVLKIVFVRVRTVSVWKVTQCDKECAFLEITVVPMVFIMNWQIDVNVDKDIQQIIINVSL
jgi:hypothetical protein